MFTLVAATNSTALTFVNTIHQVRKDAKAEIAKYQKAIEESGILYASQWGHQSAIVAGHLLAETGAFEHYDVMDSVSINKDFIEAENVPEDGKETLNDYIDIFLQSLMESLLHKAKYNVNTSSSTMSNFGDQCQVAAIGEIFDKVKHPFISKR